MMISTGYVIAKVVELRSGCRRVKMSPADDKEIVFKEDKTGLEREKPSAGNRDKISSCQAICERRKETTAPDLAVLALSLGTDDVPAENSGC